MTSPARTRPAKPPRKLEQDRRSLLKGAVLSAAMAAVATPASGRSKMKRPSAEEIIKLLDLSPNATCGFVRVTYMAKLNIAAGGNNVSERQLRVTERRLREAAEAVKAARESWPPLTSHCKSRCPACRSAVIRASDLCT